MPDTVLPTNAAPTGPALDADLVFDALAHPARRRLLVSLAVNGPRPAAELTGAASLRLSATLKQLDWLQSAKLVVRQENPQDGRKYLYALAPNVAVAKTEKGTVLDLGFATVRL